MRPRLEGREKRIVNAAQEVATRWAIVLIGGGQNGDHGMADALEELARALDAYEPDEVSCG